MSRLSVQTLIVCLTSAVLMSSVGGAQQAAPPAIKRPALLLQNAHAEAVHAVTFRPDGRVVASGSADLTIKIWETATGALLRTLSGHYQRVRALAFSGDGRRLISSADDRQLILWDPSSGSRLTAFQGTTAFTALAISPDGIRVAAAGVDSTLLFEIRSDSLVATSVLAGVSGALAWSADGRWLASTGDGGSVFDQRTARPLRRLGSKARCVAFRSDGNVMLAGDELEIFEPASGRLLEHHPISSGEHCTLSPTGTLLAGVGADNRIRLWRLDAPQELTPLAGHEGRFGWVYDLAFTPDGMTLASAGDDHSVRLWDPTSGRLLRSLTTLADPVESVAFGPGGKILATGGLGPSGDVQLWELRSGAPGRRIAGRPRPSAATTATAQELAAAKRLEDAAKQISQVRLGQSNIAITGLSSGSSLAPGSQVLARIMAGLEQSLRPLAFAPDGRFLASGSLSRYLDLWDPASGERLRTLTAHLGQVRAVVFAPDGRTLATAGEDRMIKVWDATTFYILQEFREAHRGMIRDLAFSADGSLLASSAYNDPAIKVWSVGRAGDTTHVTIELTGGPTYPSSLAFSQDGRSLVVCGNLAGAWDTRTGERAESAPKIEDGRGFVVACTLNSAGTVMALGDRWGRIRLVDFRNGKLLHLLSAHDGPIWSLGFDSSGSILVASSADSRVTFWEVSTGILLATAVSLRSGEDWLVAAPDGLFDGTPGGAQLLRWRFSEELLDTAPAEAFFNEYYRPGLLADLMAGRRPVAPREIGRLDRRSVELSVARAAPSATGSTREAELLVHATQAAPNASFPEGSGVRDVRLFRNGSLVKAWRGDVLQGRSDVTLRTRVPLVAGENRFTAYAFNRDDVRGPVAELMLAGDSTAKRKGTLYLLAIGVNRYANPDFNLTYAVADARDFVEQMAIQQAALSQYAAVKTIAIYDREATRANIMAALTLLAGRPVAAAQPPVPLPAALAGLKAVRPEDGVFVFYAGHGTASGRSFYLIPHDLGYSGSRESITAADAKVMLARSISDRDLEKAFESIDAAHLVLIIDACNSGQALESEETRRGPMNSRGLAQLAYEKGMYILTAAQGYQAALEASQLGHGLLTFALVEDGLRAARADVAPRDGKILLREWLDYSSLRVPQMQQTLMLEARKVGRNLSFVDGEGGLSKLEDRSLQRPRVFYRREAETTPFVVARPAVRAP